MRILLVEDDDDTRTVIAFHLRSAEHGVVEARDGEEALALYSQGTPFDVVVTDIHMPIMNGLELARQLRTRSKTVKIVIMSGADASPPLGVFFVAKPFTRELLFDALHRAVTSSPTAESEQPLTGSGSRRSRARRHR